MQFPNLVPWTGGSAAGGFLDALREDEILRERKADREIKRKEVELRTRELERKENEALAAEQAKKEKQVLAQRIAQGDPEALEIAGLKGYGAEMAPAAKFGRARAQAAIDESGVRMLEDKAVGDIFAADTATVLPEQLAARAAMAEDIMTMTGPPSLEEQRFLDAEIARAQNPLLRRGDDAMLADVEGSIARADEAASGVARERAFEAGYDMLYGGDKKYRNVGAKERVFEETNEGLREVVSAMPAKGKSKGEGGKDGGGDSGWNIAPSGGVELDYTVRGEDGKNVQNTLIETHDGKHIMWAKKGGGAVAAAPLSKRFWQRMSQPMRDEVAREVKESGLQEVSTELGLTRGYRQDLWNMVVNGGGEIEDSYFREKRADFMTRLRRYSTSFGSILDKRHFDITGEDRGGFLDRVGASLDAWWSDRRDVHQIEKTRQVLEEAETVLSLMEDEKEARASRLLAGRLISASGAGEGKAKFAWSAEPDKALPLADAEKVSAYLVNHIQNGTAGGLGASAANIGAGDIAREGGGGGARGQGEVDRTNFGMHDPDTAKMNVMRDGEAFRAAISGDKDTFEGYGKDGYWEQPLYYQMGALKVTPKGAQINLDLMKTEEGRTAIGTIADDTDMPGVAFLTVNDFLEELGNRDSAPDEMVGAWMVPGKDGTGAETIMHWKLWGVSANKKGRKLKGYAVGIIPAHSKGGEVMFYQTGSDFEIPSGASGQLLRTDG